MNWFSSEEKKPIDRSGPEYNYYRELEKLNKEAESQKIEYREKFIRGVSYFDEAGLKNYKLSKVDFSKISQNTTQYFYIIPPYGRVLNETIGTNKTHIIPANGEWVEFTKVSDNKASVRFFDENLEDTDYGELIDKEVRRMYIYQKPTWMSYLGKKKDAAMMKFCQNYIKGGTQRKTKTIKKRKTRRRG